MNPIFKTIGVSLLSVFMASCASRQPVVVTTSNDTLGDNCEIMREIIVKSGEDSIRSSKQLVGFVEECANYQLLALLLKHELDNPEMEAFVTTTALNILAEKSPDVKKSILKTLGDYEISEQDLIDRKEIDDAIQAVKDSPEVDCVQISDNQFFCE